MKNELKAIAFDIDGTLYANWRLYVRVVPHFLRNMLFFFQYNKVRKVLHRTAPLANFYEYQARLLAQNLSISVAEAHAKIDSIVYTGLRKYFPRVKPYAHLDESFAAFKNAGLKIGVLSDFPPEQKGDLWGLSKYCDTIMGSEACGALKPSVYAFGSLAQSLGVELSEILYVGNNISADIDGAKACGMKTAYIMPFWRRIIGRKPLQADISFKNYRQLQKLVLE